VLTIPGRNRSKTLLETAPLIRRVIRSEALRSGDWLSKIDVKRFHDARATPNDPKLSDSGPGARV